MRSTRTKMCNKVHDVAKRRGDSLSAILRHHHTDCVYELYDSVVFDNQKCTVAEMIQEIDRRGWEIGLHPSWYSFDDADELKRQKEALEKVIGHEIVSIRQHYLHYDIRITPALHISGQR